MAVVYFIIVTPYKKVQAGAGKWCLVTRRRQDLPGLPVR